MKLVRYLSKGKESYGILEENTIKELEGDIFGEYECTGATLKMEEVKLLAPCKPTKVVAIGLNYIDHVKELEKLGTVEMPKNPVLFIKLPHTVIGPGDYIIIPRGATRVDYEAELAVVLKKECKDVPPEEVDEYLLGATCLNDVTERDMQRIDKQWTRAKNFETFCPIGPCIVNGIDYNNLDIQLYLNGELRQNSNTKNLIWNVQQLVSFISCIMPLYPGDVIATGTTSGIGPMKDGDVVEIKIGGIGTLANKVISKL